MLPVVKRGIRLNTMQDEYDPSPKYQPYTLKDYHNKFDMSSVKLGGTGMHIPINSKLNNDL